MLITFIIIFLFLSALFSGSEIAYVSANKLKIELLKKRGGRRGDILAYFYDRPAEFLGTMLVGNNIALVAFTALTGQLLTPFTSSFIEAPFLLFLANTIIITAIVLLFGEFLPKTIFRLFSDNILYFLALPLRFLQAVLVAPAWIMTRLSNLLLQRFFKIPLEQTEQVFTRLDLENFVRNSNSGEEDDDIDKELFGKALNLKEIRVRECMIPRPEIEYIDVNETVDALIQIIDETKLSRIIVTENDIDNVLGYVHHQQLLHNPITIRSLIIDIPFVPEVMRITDLMNQFIKDRTYMACVVDEFGGVSGIVTLEDILEELFGEIEDEHDQEEHIETKISENEFLFSGRLEIDYLNEKYPSLTFPEGDYHTLSGYLVMTCERIPEKGSEIILPPHRFILEMVSDTKIELIRVVIQKESEPN